MKNLIKIIALSVLLNFIPIISMEQENDSIKEPHSEESELALVGNLPNELWQIIFYHIYFDSDILDEKCENIYEGLECIKVRLPLSIKNIRLVCKTFNLLDGSINEDISLERLKGFYKSLLIEKYLELRDEGFHPKSGTWGFDDDINKKIACFFTAENRNCGSKILFDIMDTAMELHLKEKVFELLLFYGVNINVKNTYNQTILNKAISDHCLRDNYIRLIKLLLANKANVNIGTGTNLTTTVRDKKKKLVELLLAYGANVNAQDSSGNTALCYAIILFDFDSQVRKEIIKLLLKYNADIDIANNQGESARIMAEEMGIDLEEIRNGNFDSNDSKKSESAFQINIKNCVIN